MPQPLIITPSSNVDSHADGDVIAAPEELVNFVQVPGGAARIDTIVIIDEGDVGGDVDLIFLNASGSIGAESSAFTMTDAVALTFIGAVNVPASAYFDAVDNKVACLNNVNMVINAAEGETSVWMGVVADASIDLTATDDLTIKIGRTFL